MFPFTLTGPQFLAFYSAFALALLLVMRLVRQGVESRPVPRSRLNDPYLIAYLRGGKNEAIRVAAVSLVDRGFLDVDDSKLKAAGKQALALVRRPIEKALLERYETKAEAKAAFDEAAFEVATADYERRLTADGLYPDEAMRRSRLFLLLGTLAVAWLVGGARVLQGLGRGRPVGFLIALIVITSVLALALHNPRRTPAGDAVLADLRQLFTGLKQRAAILVPGGGTAEAALLAGIFGLSALPSTHWGFAKKLYPKATASGSEWNSSSCGSSCGSSSGGSSCGGGGCGGGCGGCGG